MAPPQRQLLRDLIATYVGMAQDAIGQPYMERIDAGLADTAG